jgi:hypothetical protein
VCFHQQFNISKATHFGNDRNVCFSDGVNSLINNQNLCFLAGQHLPSTIEIFVLDGATTLINNQNLCFLAGQHLPSTIKIFVSRRGDTSQQQPKYSFPDGATYQQQ